ncbi:GDP-mannose 4,6-dehydratase [Herminiimonas fonticola]|uniref:GDP-mannose 4,6-dehydratase n=1 Tax=Herminiimonas fonticola TaxID=303380 RepID=A0A4R6G699_9BURK|nr:GDP-mannose 4,6-dehydratase [Herminiimonas fonticola]RBA24017.1 GDP-D-mannose dehydratase [Herminiimonas fonticola]TDN90016.1 GDPmannose 4,6-dehydratase [Herminiimonas fonticola]
MKSALITGLTGQDGLYLAELLLEKGYRIIGAVRDVLSAERRIPAHLKIVELVEWDMLDQQKMIEVLSHYRPTEVYNFAAYSSGVGMYDDPVGIGDVNGLAVARTLEAIRIVDIKIRFCQASSREIFGAALDSPQTEDTLVNPRSPYGAAKLYADSMNRIYREHYGMYACSAILFNHESPRRGLEFVTRKITHEAAKIKLGLTKELHLGNLDTERDWGFAGDTVHAMWLMLQHTHADDYIVATGETHSVREFCECAFEYLGLDYRTYVRENASAYRPSEPALLVGNASKAKQSLGWMPQVGFRALVHMMVAAEMRSLEKI